MDEFQTEVRYATLRGKLPLSYLMGRVMERRIVEIVVVLVLGFISAPVAAQTYKRVHEQIFCNILGNYAADGVSDYYNHVPLDQSLRRTDGYVCTDDLEQVCQVKVSMIQDSMRHWYAFAQQRGYDALQPATFNILADSIRVNATSACSQATRDDNT